MFGPVGGPNDPRLPKHFTKNDRFDPNFPGGPGLEGKGFRYLNGRHGNGGGNDQPMGLLSAFLPGQRNALAQQLNQGFGGGLNHWNGMLGQTYSNMKYPMNPLGFPQDVKDQNDGRGNNNGGNGGGNGGGGGFDNGHYNPSSMAPMMTQGQRPGMQVQNPAMMPGAMQPPMQSIQGPAQPQMMFGQQPQIGGPMLAMLRQRLMGGA